MPQRKTKLANCLAADTCKQQKKTYNTQNKKNRKRQICINCLAKAVAVVLGTNSVAVPVLWSRTFKNSTTTFATPLSTIPACSSSRSCTQIFVCPPMRGISSSLLPLVGRLSACVLPCKADQAALTFCRAIRCTFANCTGSGRCENAPQCWQ